LLSGYSLRTFMMPDSAIPSNNPEHVECYRLPHVLIFDDQFWGKTETAHISCGEQHLSETPCAFCYTSFGQLFFSYNPSINGGVLMSKRRYKQHDWVLKADYRLVWDSDGDADGCVIRDEISKAAALKVALLDSEGVWHIHPVDLPMFFPDSGQFVLKSVSDAYPGDFKVRSTIEALYEQLYDYFEKKPDSNADGCMNFQCQAYSTFYNIHSDGTYSHYDDIRSGVKRTYQRLKIFSDQLL